MLTVVTFLAYVIIFHILITFLNLSFKENLFECIILFFTLPLLALVAAMLYIIYKISNLL